MNWKRAWRKRVRRFTGTSQRRRQTVRPRSVSAPVPRASRAKALFFVSKIVFFLVIAGILSGAALFAWYAKDLPRPDKIVREEGFSTRIYDRNGEVLYDVFADQKRTPVQIDQIPLALQQATIAIEDKNFYEHKGFDMAGMLRAARNIVLYRKLQGGSTLTQQLVKNVLLTQKRVISRKIKEFVLAVQIESRYSKDEILQMYLNEAPYGGTAWGVGAAAEKYFGKNVAELNLLESAILAGLTQSPTRYSPFGDDPDAYIDRTKVVLRRMQESGYLTKEEEIATVEQLPSVVFSENEARFEAPHFVMYVRSRLEEKYGQRTVEQGGLRVYTTLDLELQRQAQETVAAHVEKIEDLNITNGGAVVMNPKTGEILAMIGSKDYFDPEYDGKVNVTLAQRQPGSSIKPVTYLTGLKQGYTASSLLMDTRTVFPIGGGQPDYIPENYNGQFNGPMQMRFALGNSINVTAVKMLAKVGVESMLQTAFDLGLSTLEPTAENLSRFGLAVTLGGGEVRLLEMVQAYSAFANTGLRVEPIAILKVTDQEGKILEEVEPKPTRRVISEGEAFIISHMLSDNAARAMTFGANSYLNVSGRQVAVKTGTTNDKRDNWTIGWTPQAIVGVWVGNNDNSPMERVASGVSGASPIWREIMIEALEGRPAESFTVPEDVVTAEVDVVSGYRAHDGWPSRLEYFVKGTEPTGTDPVHTKLKLCRGQEKLATKVDVTRGHYEEKEFFVFREEDPVSSDGVNRWQEGIDAWLAGQPDPRYHPPTEYCDTTGEMEINIITPADRVKLDDNEVQIKAEAISAKEVERTELYINGELRERFDGKRFDKIYTLMDGTYTIRVEGVDVDGGRGVKDVRIGINMAWDWEPSPTPTLSPTATPSPSPAPTPQPTPTP